MSSIQKAELELLRSLLNEVSPLSGKVATDAFNSLRDVDAKVRELKLILEGKPAFASMLARINSDPDFSANSRRVRLEALANYIRTIIKFDEAGGTSSAKVLKVCPDLSRITSTNPGLDAEVAERWREAQVCQANGCYLSAVILMGSILEGLLLAKTLHDPSAALLASKAPKEKSGKVRNIPDWNLHDLIEVAVELNWLKVDRGRFSHALRQSRNAVHPWEAIANKTNFDEGTCQTSWEVLCASVSDLLRI